MCRTAISDAAKFTACRKSARFVSARQREVKAALPQNQGDEARLTRFSG
jgi:hypothetical protein